MDGGGGISQGHLSAFGEQLLQKIAEELDKRHAILDAQMKELLEDHKRLLGDLCFDQGKGDPTNMFSCPLTPRVSEQGEDAKCTSSGQHVRRESEAALVSQTLSQPRESHIDKLMGAFDINNAGEGVIKVRTLQEKMMDMIVYDDFDPLKNFSPLVAQFRAGRPELFDGLQEDEISIRAFQELMTAHELPGLDIEHIQTLNLLRSSCVCDDALGAILVATGKGVELSGDAETQPLRLLEHVILGVIVVNAVMVGVSMEYQPDHVGWEIGERVCTACFVIELLVKLIVEGWREYLCGSDWKWNIFDFVLVVAAVAEESYYAAVPGASTPANGSAQNGARADTNLTMFRLVRVFRLARVAKVLKLKFMKDFTMMAMGVLGGIRTLFCAMALLFLFVYVLAIFTRQQLIMWESSANCTAVMASSRDVGFNTSEGVGPNESFTFDQVAVWSQEQMCAGFHNMFGNLPRTGLTIFRCIIGDCNLPEGLPLSPVLWDTVGPEAVIVYMLCTLFVIICVFNLIMAIFVENTLDYAKHDQNRMQLSRRKEQIRLAKLLQQFVDNIVRHTVQQRESIEHTVSLQGMSNYIPNKGFHATPGAPSQDLEVKVPTHFNVKRQAFDAAMADEDIDDVLEDLEISSSSKMKLFDIFDSDGNGTLELHEIVDGVMRLRGPADKSDVIANGLMVRHMQKRIIHMAKSIDNLNEVLHGKPIKAGARSAPLPSAQVHADRRGAKASAAQVQGDRPARRAPCRLEEV